MLNKSGITTVAGVSTTQILANVSWQVTVGCVVPTTLGEDDGEGRKIAPAGTPIKVDFEHLENEVAKADGETAFNAVLLHDVDVTSAKANGTALIAGVVNINRLSETAKAAYETAKSAEGTAPTLIFVVQ